MARKISKPARRQFPSAVKPKTRHEYSGKPVKKARAANHLVAIGDVHGELDGLLELLLHAGLIDGKTRWRGGGKTLVQLGDVVDRGPRSQEVNQLFARLQKEAREAGGKVIRLIGNHELELLKDEIFLTTLFPKEALIYRVKLIQDILSGDVQGAYSEQGYLFTHAGVMPQLQKVLDREIGPVMATERHYSEMINKILMQAVANDDYSHPIFNIGKSRGGPHDYGGVFWEDIRRLMDVETAARIQQVVGHTPVKRILYSGNGRIIGIDVGLFKGYGGGRAYLVVKGGKTSPVELSPAKETF